MDKEKTTIQISKDTGSSTAQVGFLKKRIELLANHLKTHPKDNHSRRGLMAMLNKKKKLEKYIHTQTSNDTKI